MTVESTYEPNVLSYTGPGRYDFTFFIREDTDLVVTFIDTLGVQELLSRNNDYTVVKNVAPSIGGYITTSAPADTEGQIELSRAIPLTQPVRWSAEGNLNLDKVEESFDRSVLQIQQAFAAIRNAAMQLVWRGVWVSLYDYSYLDIVKAANGNWYCCLLAHTSGTFVDDLADGFWIIFIDVDAILQEARDAMEAVADDMTAIGERSDAVSTDFYEATAGQTEFVITTPAKEDNILVFMNTRKLRLDEDYTLNSTVAASLLTLTAGAELGDELEIISFNTYDITGLKDTIDAAVLSTASDAAQTAEDRVTVESLTSFTDPSVDSISALAALTTHPSSVYVNGRISLGDGGEGRFVWNPADLSTEVASDPVGGVYVPKTTDMTGSSGAWTRKYAGAVDVRWFGVLNDGTDVSSNLLAVCNFIQYLGGGRIDIPFTDGTILATGRCNLTDLENVEIVSYGATIKVPNGTADTEETPPGLHSIFRFDNVNGLILKGLKLNGNISNRTALVAHESFNSNIRIAGCSMVRIIDCENTEAMTDGITVTDSATTAAASSDVLISGGSISKARRNNISGTGQDNLIIENVDVSLAGSIQGTAPKAGIDIEPNVAAHSYNVVIRDNNVHDNYGMGITIGGEASDGITVTGNIVDGNANVGINLDTGSSGIKISDNRVTDGGGDHGIRVIGPGAYEVSGNTVTGCTAGIYGNANNGVKIFDNVVFDNASGITADDFILVDVYGNTIRDNGTGRGFYGVPDSVDSIVKFSNNIVMTTLSTGDQQKGAELSAECVDLAVGNFFKNILVDTNYLVNFKHIYNNYAPDAGVQGNNNGPMNFSGTPVGNVGQLHINDKLHGAATTAPASGTWAVGDIVYDTAPAPSGTIGWVCTTGGTPGTWKAFGAIAA